VIQAIPNLLTFEEFSAQYPEHGGRYELVDGEIIEMRPIGRHEKIAGLISRKFDVEIERLKLPYFIPRNCLVKPGRANAGYLPDIIVLDEKVSENDPLWEKSSTVSMGSSARLAVEVVSTNWRDDYLRKLDEYELLGIPEYWIVDYLALGAIRYIGSPKQPTLSVYQLIDGEYQVQQFKGTDQVISQIFPELSLTVNQIWSA
jgi:Uma2 family endonuclease